MKYHCAKCGRRFVDWGAEKLGFKCPDCEDEELVRAGGAEERPTKRPSLKRGLKRAAPVAPVEPDETEPYDTEAPAAPDDEEELVGESEEEEEEEAFVAPDEEESGTFVRSPAELITPDPDEDEVEIDMPEELSFGEVAPSLSEEVYDEPDEEFE